MIVPYPQSSKFMQHEKDMSESRRINENLQLRTPDKFGGNFLCSIFFMHSSTKDILQSKLYLVISFKK